MKNIHILGKHLYITFAALSVLPCLLLFSNSVWFDEAYTLALIKHSFVEIIELLAADMHPPLYFICMKLFCTIFGYSLISTKFFSVLGFVLTLLLGPTLVKKTFSNESALLYMLILGAIPMMYYFSTQQRAYSFCILFVTLVFIYAIKFLRDSSRKNIILLTLYSVFASYCHIYSLIACGIILSIFNITVLLKKRIEWKKLLFSDCVIIFAYLPWLVTLLSQVKSAVSDFWLKSVEPLSVIVFGVGIAFSLIILLKSRRFEIFYGISVVLALQIIGLGVTIFIRPLYIARYSVVIVGIFVLVCAVTIADNFKKYICILLCVLNIGCFTFTAMLEYNPSLPAFIQSFNNRIDEGDMIVCLDSSFGIFSFYYPDNEIICTYKQDWFDVFENVKSINKNDFAGEVTKTAWLVKNKNKPMPEYIEENYKLKLEYGFTSDFNKFEVYLINPQK